MKRFWVIFIIFIVFVSCQKSREKDFQEMVLSEEVYQKNGIYYTSDANHNDIEYSGEEKFYYENGKLKGKAIIKVGIPEGHWEYWNEDGTKKLDLYFENGIVTRRIIQISKK